MDNMVVELTELYDANPGVDVLLCAQSPGENPVPDLGERVSRAEAAALLSAVAGSLRASLVIAKQIGRFTALPARTEDPARSAPALRFASVKEALELAQRLEDGDVMDPSVPLETAADQTAGWLTIVCAKDNAANAAVWADAEARAIARKTTTAALVCFLALDYVDTDGSRQSMLSMLWS